MQQGLSEGCWTAIVEVYSSVEVDTDAADSFEGESDIHQPEVPPLVPHAALPESLRD